MNSIYSTYCHYIQTQTLVQSTYCHYIYTYTSNIYTYVYHIGYGLGMVVTYVVMFVTESAQPALVFLVPGTLIPTHVCALLHREWKVVFFGPPKSGNQANVSSTLLH